MTDATSRTLPEAPDERQVRRNADFSGSIAGVSGGTVIVAVASNLPDSNPLKLRGLFVWIQLVGTRWNYNRVLARYFHDTEATIQRSLSDRSLSPEFREELRKEKEALHRSFIASKVRMFEEARKNRPG